MTTMDFDGIEEMMNRGTAIRMLILMPIATISVALYGYFHSNTPPVEIILTGDRHIVDDL
jgi:hypothetical protein